MEQDQQEEKAGEDDQPPEEEEAMAEDDKKKKDGAEEPPAFGVEGDGGDSAVLEAAKEEVGGVFFVGLFVFALPNTLIINSLCCF